MRCGSVETCRNAAQPGAAGCEAVPCGGSTVKAGEMSTVTLKNLKKVYPNTEDSKKKRKKNDQPEKTYTLKVTEEGVLAVQDFSLEIADKEFIVLVGPSGCGKSTTLRMIAGLEEISGGELYIDDKLVNDVAPKTGTSPWSSRTTRCIPT